MEGFVRAVGDEDDEDHGGHQPPPAAAVVEPGRQRQQHDPRQQGRDHVADVDPEADRFALGAGGAERREEVGEEAEEGNAADPANDPVAAAEKRPERGQGGGTDDQRPEDAEGLVQAGAEVVAPDAGVGRVVGDAEVRTAFLQALGMGQRDRAEAVDLGNRVAGDDQVAQVPVAAAEQRRREPPPRRRPTPPLRRQDEHREAERGRHRQHRDPRPRRQPHRQTRPPPAPTPAPTVAELLGLHHPKALPRRRSGGAGTRPRRGSPGRRASGRRRRGRSWRRRGRGRPGCGTRAGSPPRPRSAARARRAGRRTRRRGRRPRASRS